MLRLAERDDLDHIRTTTAELAQALCALGQMIADQHSVTGIAGPVVLAPPALLNRAARAGDLDGYDLRDVLPRSGRLVAGPAERVGGSLIRPPEHRPGDTGDPVGVAGEHKLGVAEHRRRRDVRLGGAGVEIRAYSSAAQLLGRDLLHPLVQPPQVPSLSQ